MITANRRIPSWPLRIDPIARGSVDVWCVSVQSLERRLEALSALLTPAEIAKAKAYKFERHRRRFCIGRGMLRAMLGEYLGQSPGGIALAQGAEGKPALAGRARESLHFNVSHSADLVVYTFCRDAEVGTDVEYLDRTLNRDLLVNRAFSQPELECYYAAGVRERLRTFFQIWARKEARLKARGLRMAQLSEESLNRLPVVDFAFGESYVGAVAMRTAELASTSGVLRPTVAHRARANARAIAA